MSPDERFPTVAHEFAQAILNKDYARAYELVSSDLIARMDFDAFTKAFTDAEREYGKPERFEFDMGCDDRDQLRDYKFPTACDFDESIPPLPMNPDTFRMWMVIEFRCADPDAQPCGYDCWLLIVEEEWEFQIGHFEIMKPD